MKTKGLELRTAAQEVITALGLTNKNEQGEKVPVILEDNAPDNEVEELFKEAIAQIVPTDKFSPETMKVVNEYDPSLFAESSGDAPAEGKTDDLITDINSAERLKDLKELAKENEEFKSIRGQLSSYKSVDDLRDAMLELLNDDGQQAVAEKIHEQNIEKKGVVTDDADKEKEAEEKPKPAKEKKPKVPKSADHKTRAAIFAEIYKEGKPLTMGEWADEMNSRSDSDSLAGAKTFTALYMQILVELGFVEKTKTGMYVKAKK